MTAYKGLTMRYTAEEVKNATEMLKKFCPQGETVQCVLRGVSRSGMQRRIDFYVIVNQNRGAGMRPYLQYISGWMAVLLGMTRQDRGLKVNGCGMDMGFHMVDTLASALYGRDKRGIGAGLRHEWI